MNQQAATQQNPTTQSVPASPNSIKLSTTPGLKPDCLLQAVSIPSHFVRGETIDAEKGLAFPTAENYAGPAYQITFIARPAPESDENPEPDEAESSPDTDKTKPALLTVPNSDSDFGDRLLETVTIMDFDTPQQSELDEELEDALLGKGQNWHLVNIICQEGCIFLEFGRSDEDGQLIPPADKEDTTNTAIAMVDPYLNKCQIIFQTALNAGIVVDSVTEDGRTTTTVTKIYHGIIISQSVNTFSSVGQGNPHHWDIKYTS